MKIRIKGNSIRYRLTKTDVDVLGSEGYLEERTEFPDGSIFRYCLQRKDDVKNLEAYFTGDRINIYVPREFVKGWNSNDVIGFDNTIDLDNGKKLFLLIEKDFVCLDHTLEDQSDNYPNPNKVC
jgi:hypothetical protein